MVAGKLYPKYEIHVLDKKLGWDVMKKGIPSGNWDVILANHVLEHLDDPDKFLDQVWLKMNSDTIFDIGMPNLNSWYNRIFFLFGYLPQSYEISYKNIYGRFIEDGCSPGGHIRVMNIPSTIQLLKDHGFHNIFVKGEASNRSGFVGWVDKLITKLNPNLASAFRIKCTI